LDIFAVVIDGDFVDGDVNVACQLARVAVEALVEKGVAKTLESKFGPVLCKVSTETVLSIEFVKELHVMAKAVLKTKNTDNPLCPEVSKQVADSVDVLIGVIGSEQIGDLNPEHQDILVDLAMTLNEAGRKVPVVSCRVRIFERAKAASSAVAAWSEKGGTPEQIAARSADPKAYETLKALLVAHKCLSDQITRSGVASPSTQLAFATNTLVRLDLAIKLGSALLLDAQIKTLNSYLADVQFVADANGQTLETRWSFSLAPNATWETVRSKGAATIARPDFNTKAFVKTQASFGADLDKISDITSTFGLAIDAEEMKPFLLLNAAAIATNYEGMLLFYTDTIQKKALLKTKIDPFVKAINSDALLAALIAPLMFARMQRIARMEDEEEEYP
jgi:hypothetical protein